MAADNAATLAALGAWEVPEVQNRPQQWKRQVQETVRRTIRFPLTRSQRAWLLTDVMVRLWVKEQTNRTEGKIPLYQVEVQANTGGASATRVPTLFESGAREGGQAKGGLRAHALQRPLQKSTRAEMMACIVVIEHIMIECDIWITTSTLAVVTYRESFCLAERV